MTELSSFRSVIELWPSRDGMAAAIGAKPSQVSKWWQRDRIPDDWWASILATHVAVEANVTAEAFVRLAAREVAA